MGLVSIWATEETGGEKPSGAKLETPKGGKLGNKWSKPITLTSKLESQWASNSSDTKEESNTHSKKGRGDRSSYKHDNDTPRFNKTSDRAHGLKSYQDKDHRRRHQKGQRTDNSLHGKHIDHETFQAPVANAIDDSDEETVVSDKLYAKGPMTKAAQSLAARITIEPKRSETDADDTTAWKEVSDDDEVKEKEEGRLKKPTQGKSLATRLDNLSFKEAKHKTTDAGSSRTKERRGMKKDVHKQPSDRLAKGNKTTKPGAEKVNPIDEQAAKEREEKEKVELLKMIEEFESKKIDWASFEE